MQSPPDKERPLSYGHYLQLDQVLAAQSPRSGATNPDGSTREPAHDEMLFIIVHQAHELWFKQVLYELDSVIALLHNPRVAEADVGLANARLERIQVIFSTLLDSIRVLETMTPMDFLEFRNHLSPASGFQSVQFRLVEAKLGLPRHHLERLRSGVFAEVVTASELQQLNETLDQASLFNAVERWLERTPFLETQEFQFWSAYKDAIEKHLHTDRDQIADQPTLSAQERSQRLTEIDRTHKAFMNLFDEKMHAEMMAQGVKRLSLKATHAALFIFLYREKPLLQAPFRLLTLLTKIDEHLQTWRAQHAQMVHRMLGIKVGTGGSSGYPYLRSTVDTHRIFGDLCDLSTFLLPRSALPQLPENFLRQMDFH
jgi:tryptophan 2,3-dioxygenase